MSTKRIILISGYARSGKDSLANALEKELAHLEPVRVKFADPLKRAVQLVLNDLGLGHIDAFTEDEELKKILRPLMVEVGKCARTIDKDVFVRAAWRDISDLFQNGKSVAIVPDLRYSNEIERFKEWAYVTDVTINHLRICRMGNEAANEEELQSICSLPQADATRIFIDGDLEGIERWAKELCRKPSMPVVAPIDPAKVEAYCQPNKGTEAWLNRDPYPVPTTELLKRIETLEGRADGAHKGLMEDNDNMTYLIRRVDNLTSRLEAMEGIYAQLIQKAELTEARLRRLESKTIAPNF